MGYVVSLLGYVPPARYDGISWSGVIVEEADGPDGTWTAIDTQALSPLDADPASPGARNVTTTQATLTLGWYRLTFTDAQNNRSGASDPERSSIASGALPPTPDDIRNESPLLRGSFPVPATTPFQAADLRNVVYQATALVQSSTWRLIDPTLGDLAAEDYQSEAVPAGMVPIAINAIARMSERIFITTEARFARQIATGRRLRGFSAGPYSEQYFAPGEFARRGAMQSRPSMDVDDALDTALWALATEDARDYFVWRATGVTPPIGSVTSFDYRRQSIGYQGGGMGFGVGGFGHGGPDGY